MHLFQLLVVKIVIFLSLVEGNVVKSDNNDFLKPFHHKPKPHVTRPLYSNFQVQYLVITGEETHNRAQNIWSTWGQRVGKMNNDSILFVTDINEKQVNNKRNHESVDNNMKMINVLETSSSWDHSYRYRQSQLKWMRSLVLSDTFSSFDWLVFIDDDTFLILNSMREMLQRYDSTKSLLLAKKNGDNSICGGAGFAMSKKMVQILMTPKHRFNLIHAFENTVNDLSNDQFYADVILSKFIYDHIIGNIINIRELKNEGKDVIMRWYKKHPDVKMSGVITYHHVSQRTEYQVLFKHYYSD